MNKIEITEGNRLIASFMGKVITFYGNKSYHTSWDWLMPVIKKIKTDAMQNPYPATAALLHGNLNIALTIVDMNKVWLAVVEFIKWHNSQIKELKKAQNV